MQRYVLRRLLLAVPTLLGITLLTFMLAHAAPGDPLDKFTDQAAGLSPEDREAVRSAYGLDLPLPLQYLAWLGRALTGDFGRSFHSHQPALAVVAEAIPATLMLTIPALLLSLLVGVALGATAAARHNTAIDGLVRLVSVGGHALPAFWVGIAFVQVFAVQLGWFPTGGTLTVGKGPWDIADRLWHLTGPVATLSLAGVANYARYVRTEMLDVLASDAIRTAQAKGLARSTVLYRHALRNAMIPIVTAVGSRFASILSGAIGIEFVFGWPGLGRETFKAAQDSNYPVVMAGVVVAGVLVVLAYLLRDLSYALADPRIRIE